MRRVFKTLLCSSLAVVVFASVNIRAEEAKGPCVVSAKAKEIQAFVEPKFVESSEPFLLPVTADRNPEKFNVAAVIRLPVITEAGFNGNHISVDRIKTFPFSNMAEKVPQQQRPQPKLIKALQNGGFASLDTYTTFEGEHLTTDSYTNFLELAVCAKDRKQAREGMHALLTLFYYGQYVSSKNTCVAELEKYAVKNNQAIAESFRLTQLYEEGKTKRKRILIDTQSVGPMLAQLRTFKIDSAGTQARIETIDKLLRRELSRRERAASSASAVTTLANLRITATVDLAEIKAKEKATHRAIADLEDLERQADVILSDINKMQSEIMSDRVQAETKKRFRRMLVGTERIRPYFTEKENPIEIRPIKFVYEEK